MYGVDFVAGTYGDVDWERMRASGRTFAYVQATEGVSVASEFSAAWPAIRASGLLRGAWHVLTDREHAAEQAVRFLKVVELQRGDLPPVLDMTQLEYASPRFLLESIRTWVSVVDSELEARHGRAPRIIVRTNHRTTCTRRECFELEAYDVWVIDHDRFDAPKLPAIWQPYDWSIHQYTPAIPGLPGVLRHGQLDRFNPLKLSDRGRRVERVKRRMRDAGFGLGVSETSNLDQTTRDALVRFQAARGLVQDGIVGPETFAELEWSSDEP